MARIRTVKPQHWEDKALTEISLQAHLMWIGMWNFSDDEGVIEADPLLIKSNIFPRRSEIRVEQVSQWIDQLVKARFLVPFEYKNEGYYIHRTFKTHQKIDRPQASKIPPEIIRRILDESSTNVRPCIVEDSKSKGGEKPLDFSGRLEYNVEEVVKSNPVWFEQVCMNNNFNQEAAKTSLRKYHLYLEEKDKYPIKRKSLFAGFEKWLMGDKNPGSAPNKVSSYSDPNNQW